MSGRGRGRGRIKRQAVESEDGWTVITHGLSKISVGKSTDTAKSHGKNEELASSQPPPVVEGLSPEKLLGNLEKLQEQWNESAVAHQVRDLLGSRQSNVTEAVCIGIGSFSRDWEHRHRSMWQLVLFLDIAKHLGGAKTKVQLYAQEPAFTTLDISFCQLLNIEVEDSRIESHISPSSFVFSPFVDWFILLPIFLKGKDPTLYVGNEILDDYGAFAQTDEKRAKLEESNGLGKTFLKARDCVKLKDFERHAHALNGMVLYTRAEKDDLENEPT